MKCAVKKKRECGSVKRKRRKLERKYWAIKGLCKVRNPEADLEPQGKRSHVLPRDAKIVERFRVFDPSNPRRDGTVSSPEVRILARRPDAKHEKAYAKMLAEGGLPYWRPQARVCQNMKGLSQEDSYGSDGHIVGHNDRDLSKESGEFIGTLQRKKFQNFKKSRTLVIKKV
jgi:hypothetical protein